jgi:2-phosphosulfolactate phosphatase
MHIDIQLFPFPPSPHLLSGRRVVVIDILRATSVIVRAISQGAKEIIPVITVEEAFQLVKRFPRDTTLLGGERGSQRVKGFDLGNSPREYTSEKVGGKSLILTTTNGTRAFHSVSSAAEILVGSFFNVTATAQRCLDKDDNLLIYPSGDEGDFSLEDTVCGGMLVDRIIKIGQKPQQLTDASQAALVLYQRFQSNLSEALSLSHHGRELIDQGYGDDLPYCALVDMTNMVPVFEEGVIRIQLTPSPLGRGEG